MFSLASALFVFYQSNKDEVPLAIKRSAAGNLATVAAMTPLYPLELIKTRCQIQGEIANSATKTKYGVKTVFETCKQEGIKGMFRGYSVSLMCIPVYNALYFPVYEYIRGSLRTGEGEKGFLGKEWKEGDLGLYAVSAGVAGAGCLVVTNPLWIVRTRM